MSSSFSPWNSPGQSTGVALPFPSPGDLPNPGIEPRSPGLQADSLPAEPPGNFTGTHYQIITCRHDPRSKEDKSFFF